MDKKGIEKVVSILAKSNNIVVVTGAGISTEAGVPDFRGENGIYRKLGENRVLNILNINYFNSHPDEFYDFYRQYFTFPKVDPGKAHRVLADMEKKGWIKAVVTQNIDGLHQAAGSRKVVAIHGNAESFVCPGRKCRQVYGVDYLQQFPHSAPTCAKCGSILKPDVVLFGEQIQNYMEASELIMAAKTLIVIGSSLTVYPLAGFVKEFSTFYQDLIIINRGYTQLDHAALVKIDGGHTGDTLEEIYRQLTLLKN